MEEMRSRLPGIGVALTALVAMTLVVATVAWAQTPAEDQYGSPTGPPVTSGEGGGDAGSDPDGIVAAADPGGSAASSASPGAHTEGAEDATGGVLPSTGGAPIYLLLAGTILLGTGATLWMRSRAHS